MDRELDVLTLLLLDPCLTADEAAREAAAVAEVRDARTRSRKPPRAEVRDDGPAVGF